MSGKLDQSLDQIMKDTKPTGGRGRRQGNRPRSTRRAATRAKAAIAAPAGGVQKNTRANTKPVTTAAKPVTAPLTGDSKIVVSNLPEDVDEALIKDYFGKTIGHVKRAMLTYGPSGRSRGIATIIFSDAGAAAKAAKQLDGVKVDNRAMRIEVVINAKQAPAPPAPKSLADRVSQPRNAAKEKTKATPKATPATANGAANVKGSRGRGKAGRGGKPKKKTAAELDAEMVDYFGADGAPNGTAQPAATNGGEVVDEVM